MYAPLDPECKLVKGMKRMMDDPITIYYGMGTELWQLFERNHRPECPRCTEYGLSNIEEE